MSEAQKQCHFCTNNAKIINYKDSELLRKYMTPQARIMPKRRSGVCAKHQRILARAIKRARTMGLVPFTIR
ncbi:MAG: 30S ribosomal protein S18 [Candidatus Ryanbacteria bacterium RIFCSPHIGHO2_02_FULL_45_43]|uniref:Small ribosomal subunit protein bS18 n=1 Tax=Candidatus Ryanbacteria bacterium RIFCSPHIGHO2_01_45_13 TaxID=1802112 RepID=A0A1G2FUU5_9BACT|nr:MAG: 30S ribosomal protein S18 [Candidatus Ryanbacteria bacterium RIFCSPHIGHO2_01_45_13]OGZ41520.1 MAG: 30S ribosomal protein S18 [Candidatus Ryanbacteria bacterium RIFCSPHIGHO2_01_FULL_44_130]OGZ47987.1 MAG: 30S ribosomal protein S18 [Candidatus Ryanbacteria bacterium RIFCSPHIGHO2_02_FULL_45_43]OGZ50123.1 MAG: 30S ribosomal protein S18 [Candidatus Ryanbacteria bacterium RIFCSPHIGHO2_12_FULL_44_20]OGZ51125.1 MAG: 30S ribosomal protein S18 [Candidatus Ryanbacteria bacterium RIFCSPLOWO2_01_FUL